MKVGDGAPGAGEGREGRYANYFETGHNAFEFILQFGQLYQEDHEPLIHTRIITSPAYAKTLLEVLQQAVAQYEEEFGAAAAAGGKEAEPPEKGTAAARGKPSLAVL